MVELLAVAALTVVPILAGAEGLWVTSLRQISVGTAGSMPGDQVHYEKPKWSPDGRALTFETRRGKERRLWVTRLDGHTPPQQLLSKRATSARMDGAFPSVGAVANYDAAWSSSGGKITYVGSGSEGYFGLYYAEAGAWQSMIRFVAGGEGDPYVAFPDYYPGEDLVVFSKGEDTALRRGGRLDLHVAQTMPPVQDRRRESQRVLNAGMMEGVPQMQPAFSPDGQAIAFVGIQRGNNDIYVLPVRYHATVLRQRGEPARLTDWPSPEIRPAWSPDGQQIAFLSGRQEGKEEWGLWVMPVGGTSPARRLQGRVMAEDDPAWYDANRILVVKIDEAAGNPLVYVDLRTGTVRALELPTVRHVYVEISSDRKRIALCARGQRTDPDLTWLKLYVGDLKTSAP